MVLFGISHAFSCDGSAGALRHKVASFYVYVVCAGYQMGLSLHGV